MTTNPAACHYDRALQIRVTRQHRDDCPTTDTGPCPATGTGCAPCTAPHCTHCNHTHATNDHPLTCPDCLGKIRADLADIRTLYATLPEEAADAARDGRPAAAAPIPGGLAQVLIGPTVRLPLLKYSRELSEDHPVSKKTGKMVDPIPPLAILAEWEDRYRTHLDHTPAGRATVGRAIAYLLTQLDYIAQRNDGPDFATFAREIRILRARLERALHDEREPERGVECFECGDQLVRRFRIPRPCKHPTPARKVLQQFIQLGYPEALTPADVRAARRPCGDCDQGGIEDPRAGLSWECPGCRREYGPGEYATAVRRDLLENGADGDGWTHVAMAAEAASTLTGYLVLPGTIRKWVQRSKVNSQLGPTGVRLVFWPDVAETAEAAVQRKIAAARRQQAAS